MKTAKTEEKKSGKPEPKATVKVDQKDAAVAGKDPYLLAVLDDIINKDEKKILFALSNILHGHLLKALITRSGSDTGIGNEGNGDTIWTDDRRSYEIKFLSDVDSSNLLQNRVKAAVSRATAFERLSAAIGIIAQVLLGQLL